MMDIQQILNGNQFLSGGALLMILGGALYYLKQLPGQIYNFLERFCFVKIEILDEDEAYQWMQIWLAGRLSKTLSVSVVTKRGESEVDEIEDNKPKVYFVPAVGTYFFWYKGRFVTLYRDRQDNVTTSRLMASVSSDKGSFRTKESFAIRIFTRNKDLAKQLIEDCRDKALPDDGKVNIQVSNYHNWQIGSRINARPMDSVILEGNQAEQLIADIEEFKNSASWYEEVGVPYRRSYLLEGPPGTGKSSVVKALAGHLKTNIYLLMLSDPNMNDQQVNGLLAKVAAKNILLLEDIDCAFNKRKHSNGDSGLTFSGMLNAIDGVASPEGRLIFMTTNHIENLDPALIRPGRADVILHFGNATSGQAKKLYERFFPLEAEHGKDFGGLIPDRKFSMATLQNYLMLHRKQPLEALRNVGELSKMQIGVQS